MMCNKLLNRVKLKPVFSSNGFTLKINETMDGEIINIVCPPHHNSKCMISQKKGEKNMSIEIKAERKRMYKIKEINMLSQVDLPSEYLARIPHVYKTKNGEGFVLRYVGREDKAVNTVFVDIGDEFTEHKLALIEKMIKASGQRLHDINHKNDKKKTENEHKESVEWAGTHIFKV